MEFIQENAWVIIAVLGFFLAFGTIIFKFAEWRYKVNSSSNTLKADNVKQKDRNQ